MDRQSDQVQAAHQGDAVPPLGELRFRENPLEYAARVDQGDEHGLVRRRNIFAEDDVHDPQKHVLTLARGGVGVASRPAHPLVEEDRPARIPVEDASVNQALGGPATDPVGYLRSREPFDPVDRVLVGVGRGDGCEHRVQDTVSQRGRVHDRQAFQVRVDAALLREVHQRRAREGVPRVAVVDVDEPSPLPVQQQDVELLGERQGALETVGGVGVGG